MENAITPPAIAAALAMASVRFMFALLLFWSYQQHRAAPLTTA
jgi:hypothetical protein